MPTASFPVKRSLWLKHMHTFSVTPPTRARTHSKLLPIIKCGFADTVHDKGILVQRFNIQHYNVTVAALHFFSGPFQHLVSDKRFSKFPTSSNILSTFLGRFCSEKKKNTVVNFGIQTVPTGSGSMLVRKGGTCSATRCHIKLTGLAMEHENPHGLS